MEFKEFIQKLEIAGWGVVAFNTYHSDGKNCYYIMVAMLGEAGSFYKDEGLLENMDVGLYNLHGFINA